MSEHIKSRLPAFVSGQCSSTEEQRIRAHLAGCATCRAALEHHQRLTADLRFELTTLPTPDLWQGVQQGMQTRTPLNPIPWRAVTVVPVVLLCLMLAMPLTLPFWAGMGYTAPPESVRVSATPSIVAGVLPEATAESRTPWVTQAEPTTYDAQAGRSLLTPVPQPPNDDDLN